jgi:hypothetical protein
MVAAAILKSVTTATNRQYEYQCNREMYFSSGRQSSTNRNEITTKAISGDRDEMKSGPSRDRVVMRSGR